MSRFALFACSLACALLSAAPASAGGAGHYKLDAIFGASKLASSAGGALANDFERTQRQIAALGYGLEALDYNLQLTRGTIEASHHDLWTARLDERFSTRSLEFEAVNEALNTSQAIMSDAFEAAQGRAIAKLESELKIDSIEECTPEAGGILGNLRGPGAKARHPTSSTRARSGRASRRSP